MVYFIRESEIKQNMVKFIKAEFDILYPEKTQGVNVGDYKGTTNANPVNDIQTEISLPTERKTISFLKPKDDRTYGERVDDCLRLDTGGAVKRFGKTQSRMVEATAQLGAISP